MALIFDRMDAPHKKAAVATLLACLTAWPLIHHGVTRHFHMDPWSFFGFAMYSVTSQGKIAASVGGWLLGLMGLQSIRLYHHIGMYAIMFFAIIHIYISWWMDTVERNGVMGSIFGGYKFVTGKEWE